MRTSFPQLSDQLSSSSFHCIAAVSRGHWGIVTYRQPGEKRLIVRVKVERLGGIGFSPRPQPPSLISYGLTYHRPDDRALHAIVQATAGRWKCARWAVGL
jgi:hypothetical protein